MLRRASVMVGVAVAALGACGPYPQVGQKLDAGLTVTNSEAWISAAGTRVRILLLGKDELGAPASFSYSDLDASTGAGGAGGAGHPNLTWQGTWSESGGFLSLVVRTEYTLPDERPVSLKDRHGASRRDGLAENVRLDAARGPSRLTLAGDPALAGTYVPVSEALAHLGTATPADAACAFYVANLGVMTTQVRVFYFGSANMVQYTSAEKFIGTLSGDVGVYMAGIGGDVTITFEQDSDIPGITLDGKQVTNSDLGGNGRTRNVVRFTFQADPTQPAGPRITGAIEYDLVITGGTATGGIYTVSIDGGATAVTDPVSAPNPPVATCLGL